MKNDGNFYKPSVSVDIVVFTIENNDLKVLTIKRSGSPFQGVPALPGGFLHKGENTLEAAKRILKDKVGLKNIYLEQLYTFDDLDRDPRGPVISVSYYALAPREKLDIELSQNTQDPTFTSIKNLGRLAFDHRDILKYAYERLRGKLEYTNIAQSLLPKEFTFTELQNVYEVIFGKKLDKRNFRKKIERLGLIRATKKKVKRGRQRPALLYTFASLKPESFKNPF
jgi:8-oxo-dGTP diphosphatase